MNDFDTLLKKFELPGQKPADDPARPRILVIDDDPSIRRGLESAFSHKYRVITAESGKAGVSVLTAEIHCVILDVKMKELNGFSTYPKLKEKSPDVPIIFYTAFQSEHDLKDVINKYKPEGYLEKGSDFTFLDHLTANAVHKYRLILENEDYKDDLEQKVAERTRDLQQALDELKAAQNQLVSQGTMAAIGNLAVGIAHNIRNPLEATRRSVEEIRTAAASYLGFYDQIREYGFTNDDRKTLLTFIRKKYFSGEKPEFLDARHLKERTDALQTVPINGAAEPGKRMLRSLAAVGILAPDLGELVPLFEKYGVEVVTEFVSLGYKIGVNTSFAVDSIAEATAIINDTMDFAGIRSDTQTSVNAAIEKTLRVMQSYFSKYNISVIREFDADLPMLNLNSAIFNQVYINLFSNAVYAMQEIDGPRELTVRTRRADGRVMIEISDTGVGIPEPIREKIFQPFFSTKPGGAGKGVGLYTVYQAVKDVGRIDVESRPGFTKFRITIDPDRLSSLTSDGKK